MSHSNVLERPTLVLNRSWQPIHVSTVQRSLVKVYADVAQVVEPDTYQTFTWEQWAELEPAPGEDFVASISGRFRLPEVILVPSMDKRPERKVAFTRRNLFRRDNFACQYCGRHCNTDELTIDHVMPRSRGGVSEWTNCVVACFRCNHRKANRTPKEAGLRLRTEPKRPRWQPLYASPRMHLESWSKFLSDAYWNVQLES